MLIFFTFQFIYYIFMSS